MQTWTIRYLGSKLQKSIFKKLAQWSPRNRTSSMAPSWVVDIFASWNTGFLVSLTFHDYFTTRLLSVKKRVFMNRVQKLWLFISYSATPHIDDCSPVGNRRPIVLRAEIQCQRFRHFQLIFHFGVNPRLKRNAINKINPKGKDIITSSSREIYPSSGTNSVLEQICFILQANDSVSPWTVDTSYLGVWSVRYSVKCQSNCHSLHFRSTTT